MFALGLLAGFAGNPGRVKWAIDRDLGA